jgi:hypothetical protein
MQPIISYLLIYLFCIRTNISGEDFDEKKCCPEKGCKSRFKYIEGFKNHLGLKHAYEEQMIQETVDRKSHPTTKNRFDFSVRKGLGKSLVIEMGMTYLGKMIFK